MDLLRVFLLLSLLGSGGALMYTTLVHYNNLNCVPGFEIGFKAKEAASDAACKTSVKSCEAFYAYGVAYSSATFCSNDTVPNVAGYRMVWYTYRALSGQNVPTCTVSPTNVMSAVEAFRPSPCQFYQSIMAPSVMGAGEGMFSFTCNYNQMNFKIQKWNAVTGVFCTLTPLLVNVGYPGTCTGTLNGVNSFQPIPGPSCAQYYPPYNAAPGISASAMLLLGSIVVALVGML